ncbi:hypothetical protein JVU11DRAFT_1665 [Chiua virens]|nr:hypothetical protein JVU11DRAFT_1665 [Chiua virens]
MRNPHTNYARDPVHRQRGKIPQILGRLRVPLQGVSLCHHSSTYHTLWSLVGLAHVALPPALQPSPAVSTRRELPPPNVELEEESFSFQDLEQSTLDDGASPSPLPRSKRQTFGPYMIDSTPNQRTGSATQFSNIEPLSIKKKSSTRSTQSSHTPTRKHKSSPLSKMTGRVISPRKVSPQMSKAPRPSLSHLTNEYTDNILQTVVSARDEVELSHRAMKRIKLDISELRSNLNSPMDSWGSSSPDKSFARTPQRIKPPPITKEAQQRMEEMRQLIGRRQAEGPTTPLQRTRSILGDGPASNQSEMMNPAILSRLEESLVDADQNMVRAMSHHETLRSDLEQFMLDIKEKAADLDRTRVELQNTKRQCELVKSLLADATAEKEIMYEAFNEELDAMYNDANLPHDEAWESMTHDLCQTKESRNGLSKENSELKRKIAELESEKEEWAALLRAHGLIS